MVNVADYLTKSPAQIMEEIKRLSGLISQQQAKADKGEFKSYDGAIGLQRLRNNRTALQAILPALTLAVDNEEVK